MVASAGEPNSMPIGWINESYLAGQHTNKEAIMGGASRLWFGPDAGPYSLFTEKGKEGFFCTSGCFIAAI